MLVLNKPLTAICSTLKYIFTKMVLKKKKTFDKICKKKKIYIILDRHRERERERELQREREREKKIK